MRWRFWKTIYGPAVGCVEALRRSSAVALIDCLLSRAESCGLHIGRLLGAHCSRTSPLVPEEPPELHVLGVENAAKQAAPRAVALLAEGK